MFTRLFLLAILSIAGYGVMAQDLTGIWRGHFRSANNSRLMDSLGIVDRYKFEVQLDQEEKRFQGVTYSYKTTVFYGKASCIGTINPANGKVLLEETRILEVQTTGGACVMTCFLQYSTSGKEEFLQGSYTGISISDSSACGKGTVFLRKVNRSDFYEEPFLTEKKKTTPAPQPQSQATTPAPKKSTPAPAPPKKETPPPPEPKLPPVAVVPDAQPAEQGPPDSPTSVLGKISPVTAIPEALSKRENALVKTITTNSREIYVRLYDNGTIDNDTVSVYLDKKLIISRKRLTDQPISFKFNLDEQKGTHELVMVAENLGEIPPNTSLMIVNAGNRQFEVRITSTEQKNALVRFMYTPSAAADKTP